MRRIYRGIDIAGDKGKTGLVDLVEEHDGSLRVRCGRDPFKGAQGIRKLAEPDPDESLAAAAIDQPLGFPAQTLRLLACPEIVEGILKYDPKRGRYRRADLEMSEELNKLGLDANKYVLSPGVCANIWRALHLLQASHADIRLARMGMTDPPWFETHPRLCIARLVDRRDVRLVREYKSNRIKGITSQYVYSRCRLCLPLLQQDDRFPQKLTPLLQQDGRFPQKLTPHTHQHELFLEVLQDQASPEEHSDAVSRLGSGRQGDEVRKAAQDYLKAMRDAQRMIEARRHCLELLKMILPVVLEDEQRRQLLDDDNTFEALFCAVAAYAMAKGCTVQYPCQGNQEDIGLEGIVFVPDYERLRIAAASRGQAAVDPEGSKGAPASGGAGLKELPCDTRSS